MSIGKEFSVGKIIEREPHPDDPIYKEGPQIYFPRVGRGLPKSKSDTQSNTAGPQTKPSSSGSAKDSKATSER